MYAQIQFTTQICFQDCGCFADGTELDDDNISLKCDNSTGKCDCKAGYLESEQTCNLCDDGYYYSNGICNDCNCHSNGTNFMNGVANCNKTSGQCDCQPEYEGILCDACIDGYHVTNYNFTNPICEVCTSCYASGTEAVTTNNVLLQCDKFNGACQCKDGYTGIYCNECDTDNGYFDINFDVSNPNCTTFEDLPLVSESDCLNSTDGEQVRITIRGINSKFSTPIDTLRVEYTCPDRSGKVEFDGMTNSNGELTLVALPTGQGVAFRIFDANGRFADNITTIVPFSIQTSQRNHETFTITLDIGCSAGHFGELCQYDCPLCNTNNTESCSDANTCNCKSGFFGSRCDDGCPACMQDNIESCSESNTCECTSEYYGDTCDKYCACYLTGTKNCDSSDGTCNCNTGYTGLNCNECDDGYYLTMNSNSDIICTACGCNENGIMDNTCDDNGNCNCTSTHSGSKCDSCVEGKYPFPSCDQDCDCTTANTVNGSDACDNSGHCSCAPGFYGNKCQNECANCTTSNIASCSNDTCNCLAGYFGGTCGNECSQCDADNVETCAGTASSDCSCKSGYSNSDGCQTDMCPQCDKNGIRSCDDSKCNCKLGYYGIDCSQECLSCNKEGIVGCYDNNCYCKQGYFGDNCENECSHCYTNGLLYCDANSCTCSHEYIDSDGVGCSGCADGFYKVNGFCHNFDNLLSAASCNGFINGTGEETTDPLIKIHAIKAEDNSPIAGIKVIYTCPDGDYFVEHVGETDSNGELIVGYFKNGTEVAFKAFNSDNSYNDAMQTVTPTKDSTNTFTITFSMSCKVGYYGTQCENQCNNCITANIESCQEDSCGNVTCSCKPGFYGTSCESQCFNCNQQNIESCDDANTCDCKPFYYGTYCDSSCSQCTTNNSMTCEGTTDDDCICNPGYYGPKCMDECSQCNKTGTQSCSATNCDCAPGFYGDGCGQQCNQCNINGISSCNQTSCICKPGYIIDNTSDDCSICDHGYYQDSCTGLCKKCSHCNIKGIETCDANSCNCQTSYNGTSCSSCALGYYLSEMLTCSGKVAFCLVYLEFKSKLKYLLQIVNVMQMVQQTMEMLKCVMLRVENVIVKQDILEINVMNVIQDTMIKIMVQAICPA